MTLTDWLTQVKARLAKATPGPWRLVSTSRPGPNASYGGGCRTSHKVKSGIDSVADLHRRFKAQRDGEFIAHAPTDLTTAVQVIERLREAVEKYGSHTTACEDEPTGLACVCGLTAALQMEVEDG